MSIGFDRERGGRQQELTTNKNVKGKYHVRTMPKDVCGFAEHHEKTTYGHGYKLTLTKNNDHAALNKIAALPDAGIKTVLIHCFFPLCTFCPTSSYFV